MNCEGKLILRSHITSYYFIIEVVSKSGLTSTVCLIEVVSKSGLTSTACHIHWKINITN